MKIIQVNIWQGKLGFQIIDFLKAEKPDIVCMQEVNDLKGRSGYKFFATLDEIKEQAGFKEVFMSPAHSSRYMERELEYGNAILSQHPIIDRKTVFTSGQYMRNFDVEKDDGNIRNLQIATIDVNGQQLHILNHHGFWVKGTKDGNDDTMQPMKLIASEIDKIGGPIIFCGDFNLTPHSQSLEIINQKLKNLVAANNLAQTGSPLTDVHAAIDHIFVNDQVKVKHFEMSDELISDHKALILDFDL